ncbi:MAG: sulfotransferase family 2 domain-containing protein [Pirellulaceae bacterium]|nr:sulfotransferase family 2 domain-containing protein [Pirellulaceae bacterium]
MLAFVHIRKTGGSTVDTILRQSFGLRHFRLRLGPHRAVNPIASAGEVRRCQWIYWRMKCLAGHGIVPHSDLRELSESLRYFTFLREPVTRCASDYQFRVDRGGLRQPFEEWIHTEYAANQQTLKIGGERKADKAIEMLLKEIGFVGILERFDESLVMLKQWVDLPEFDIRYRSKNVAARSSIKSRLLADPQTLSLLREVNQEDLKLYRYAMEEIYPKAVSRFSGDLENAVCDFRRTNQPRPVLPRQIGSILVREGVYKPIATMLSNQSNATALPSRAA